MLRLRAYLELVRLPNLFTSAADVLAGYLTISVVAGINGGQLTLLLVSTVCLYAGGVVLNDYFDEAVDRLERPERPIPSGRVPRSAARRLAVVLFSVGALAAASVGPVSLALALAIVLSAAAYDAIGKRTAFGPLNLALCRFLNLLLGVSAAPALLVDRLTFALLLMIHVTGVTVLSRGEVWGGQRPAALAMLAALGSVVAAMSLLGISGSLPDPTYALFLAGFVLLVGVPTARAYRDASAQNVRVAVKWGVLGLVLLDASIAAGFTGAWGGLAVAGLLVPSMLIARVFAVT